MASIFKKSKHSEISVGSFLLSTEHCLDEFLEWPIQPEELGMLAASLAVLRLAGSDHTLEMPWSGQDDQAVMRLQLYH